MAAVKSKSGAAKLISAAKSKETGPRLTKEAAAEVWSIIQHNDSSGRNNRVQRHEVLKMLRDDFGVQFSLETFDRAIKSTFGRTFGHT